MSWRGSGAARVAGCALLLAGACQLPAESPPNDAASEEFAAPSDAPRADLAAAALVDRPRDLTPPDLALSPLGCRGYLNCVNRCPGGDQACYSRCRQPATGKARTLFDRLTDCVFAACPDRRAEDVCFVPDAACQKCLGDVQADGGVCHPQAIECRGDLP